MNIFSDFWVVLISFLGFEHISVDYVNLALIFVGHCLFYLFAKYVVLKKIYRYDDSKRYNSIRILVVLNILSFITWIIAELTNDYEHLRVVAIFSIAYVSKFTFHIMSYINLKIYGKHKEFKQEVTNPLKKKKLRKAFAEKLESPSNDKVQLNPEFYYIVSENKFYRNVITNVSSKTSKLIDVLIFVVVFFVSLSLIIPVIGKLSEYLNNSYVLAICAFIFIYVLGPVYPNLYGSFLVIKNDNLDLGDFIMITEKNIKGRIIEVSMFWVKLKDHDNNTILTVPSSYFHNNIIENLSRFQSSHGKKVELEYIVSYDLYKEDQGARLKVIFKHILDELEEQYTGFHKGSSHNIWLTPDDKGVTVTIWYYVSDIEKEEKLKLQVEDYLFSKCSSNEIYLGSQQFLEISSKSWI